jgi:hypothetical protein
VTQFSEPGAGTIERNEKVPDGTPGFSQSQLDRSITICHLGNIAMRLNRPSIKCDPKKEQILNDAEAHSMLSRPHRSPWKLEV